LRVVVSNSDKVSTTAICYIGQIGGSTDTFECYAGRSEKVDFDVCVCIVLQFRLWCFGLCLCNSVKDLFLVVQFFFIGCQFCATLSK
jgi:hypothetical protein